MDSVLTLGLHSVLLPLRTAFSPARLDCILLGQRPPFLKGTASSLQMGQRPSPSRFSVLPSLALRSHKRAFSSSDLLQKLLLLCYWN